jgi:AraC-like DNA-binding protein
LNAENRAEAIWLQRLILAVFLMLSAEVVATLYKAIFDWESVDGVPVVYIAVLGSSLGLMGLNLNILSHRDFSSLVAPEPRQDRHSLHYEHDERPEIVQQVEAWLHDPSREGAFSESLAEYIQAHLADENTTRTSIAEHFNMSDRNLSRETQRIVGLSPHHLLQTMRMEAALQTMRTTHLTVKEAAFKNGFSSVNALQRMTRALYGESPLSVISSRTTSDA